MVSTTPQGVTQPTARRRRGTAWRALGALLLVTAGLCVGMLIGAVLALAHPDYHEPPPYPGAQQLTVLEDNGLTRISTFRTSDTPKQVVNFYRDYLTEQGWRIREWHVGGLAFSYPREYYHFIRTVNGLPTLDDPRPYVDFDVTCRPSDVPGQTEVRVRRVIGPIR